MCGAGVFAHIGASGGTEVMSSLRAVGFGQWSRDAVGIWGDFLIHIGSSMGIGDTNDWFWCRARAWPLSAYIKGVVLLPSHDACPSLSNNWPANTRGSPDQVHSQIYPYTSVLSHLSSALAFLLHILSIVFPCSSTFHTILVIPCCSFGHPMS